jgi:hypothetical protein
MIKCRETRLRKSKEYERRCKQKIIDAYGGKCQCCGESIFEFLSIDHIHNDGAQERKIKKKWNWRKILQMVDKE